MKVQLRLRFCRIMFNSSKHEGTVTPCAPDGDEWWHDIDEHRIEACATHKVGHCDHEENDAGAITE